MVKISSGWKSMIGTLTTQLRVWPLGDPHPHGVAVSVESHARITHADVAAAPVIEDVFQDVVAFLGECVLVGHHVHFDLCFLNKTLRQQFRCRLRYPCLDTMMLSLDVSGRMEHQTLDQVARFCQVERCRRHTAYENAMITAAVFQRLALRLADDSCPVSRLLKRQTEARYVIG